jgi:hypothetical protein
MNCNAVDSRRIDTSKINDHLGVLTPTDQSKRRNSPDTLKFRCYDDDYVARGSRGSLKLQEKRVRRALRLTTRPSPTSYPTSKDIWDEMLILNLGRHIYRTPQQNREHSITLLCRIFYRF